MPASKLSRILVIEHSRSVQSALKQVNLGSRLQLQFAAADAISELQLSDFAAVLADDSLFEGGAAELLIAKLRANTSAPIIYMTAIASARAAQMAISSGADAVLRKPFGAVELRNALGTVLRRDITAGGQSDSSADQAGIAPVNGVVTAAPEQFEPNSGRVAPEAVFDELFHELERRQPLQSGFDAFDVVEKQLIRRALENRQGNQSQAARFLGITRNTLRKRIQKYGFGGLISKDDDGE